MATQDKVVESKPNRNDTIKALDLTQAVEQTAIIASALFGRPGSKDHDKLVKQWSTMAMLGGLASVPAIETCRLQLDERDRQSYDEIRLPPNEMPVEVKRLAERVLRIVPAEQRPKSKPVKKTKKSQEAKEANDAPFALDLHLSPVDGKRAVSFGQEGGSLSILAGGPPQSFGRPEFTQDMLSNQTGKRPGERSSKSDLHNLEETIHYLTITVGPWLCSRLADSTHSSQRARQIAESILKAQPLDGHKDILVTSTDPTRPKLPHSKSYATDDVKKTDSNFTEYLLRHCRWDHVDQVIRGSGGIPGITALGLPKLYRTNEGAAWEAPFRKWCRVHNLRGSSVAASLSALLPRNGIHLSCAIARREHIFMSSVAAHALGGCVLAIPVQSYQSTSQWTGFRIHPNTRVLTSSDFILDKNAFLVATGISDHPALRGTQFHDQRKAHTQTLICHSAPGTLFFRKREVRLSEEKYHGLVYPQDSFINVLAEVEKTIHTGDVNPVIIESLKRRQLGSSV